MSLILTLWTSHGIVMASDSRLTMLNSQSFLPFNDTSYKTYACPNGAGISVCGNATFHNQTIEPYIDRLIQNKITADTPVSKIPDILLDFFGHDDPPNAKSVFLVAGYEKTRKGPEARIYAVNTAKGAPVHPVHKEIKYGAVWEGEQEILCRLLSQSICGGTCKAASHFNVREKGVEKVYKKAYILDASEAILYPKRKIPYAFFSLQDAVDFAEFAIETTAKAMRFMTIPKTVGGPIDILIIRPDGCEWLRRKTLSADSDT